MKKNPSCSSDSNGLTSLTQSLMCLIYLLLHHHLKIVRLARNQRVSVAEFEDMRETWEYLFEAFDKRLDNLLEVWRQQRLDISNQVDCYAGGLFKDWHERVCTFPTNSTMMHD